MSAASSIENAVLTEFAPAKVNLFLHVVRRRLDGFHDLHSLAGFVGVGDEISVEPGPPGLVLKGPFAQNVPQGADNLAWSAWCAGLAAFSRQGPAGTLVVDKQIPVAAGLGGGSADAAAVLRLLARAWGSQVDRDPRWSALAAKLGADVPVCLARRTTYFNGVGTPARVGPDLSGLHVVLVNPRQAVPTGDVFSAMDLSTFPQRPGQLRPGPLAKRLAEMGNDLTAAATGLAPAIGAVLEQLSQCQGCELARMSGSGATCFGLFSQIDLAQTAAAQLARVNPNWWVAATHFS